MKNVNWSGNGCGLVVAAVASAALLSGCAALEEESEFEEPALAEVSSALAKQIQCGQSEGFPTWWGASTTNVQATTSTGGHVLLAYKVGAGATIEQDFSTFTTWHGQWWGLTLWVSYLGFFDKVGVFRICPNDTPPPGAPRVDVLTF